MQSLELNSLVKHSWSPFLAGWNQKQKEKKKKPDEKDLKSCLINSNNNNTKEKGEKDATADWLSNKEIQSNNLWHLWLYSLKTT